MPRKKQTTLIVEGIENGFLYSVKVGSKSSPRRYYDRMLDRDETNKFLIEAKRKIEIENDLKK